MLHYSCDLCGCRIDDRRFTARVEAYPSFDADGLTEEDLDRDNLSEVSELLAELELSGDLPLDNCEPQTFRFDFCPDCYREFLKDPLARHRHRQPRFSEN